MRTSSGQVVTIRDLHAMHICLYILIIINDFLSFFVGFVPQAQSELREKVRLLESSPDLLALYKELVVTGILSSDEFWARPEFSTTGSINTETLSEGGQHKSQPNATASNKTTDGSSSTGQISRSFQMDDQPQIVGVPSYLLSDIKPEADGANGIKYNLTHETINAIFRAYPTVRQRHKELVPDKLSEADFWIKFFQSHYFHRLVIFWFCVVYSKIVFRQLIL